MIVDSCRITLVVAFGFLPQTFERWWEPMNGTLSFYMCEWWGPMNGTLSFYECRLSNGDTQRWWDTQTLPAVIKFS